MSSTDGNIIKTQSNHTYLKFFIFLFIMFGIMPGLVVGTVMYVNHLGYIVNYFIIK